MFYHLQQASHIRTFLPDWPGSWHSHLIKGFDLHFDSNHWYNIYCEKYGIRYGVNNTIGSVQMIFVLGDNRYVFHYRYSQENGVYVFCGNGYRVCGVLKDISEHVKVNTRNKTVIPSVASLLVGSSLEIFNFNSLSEAISETERIIISDYFNDDDYDNDLSPDNSPSLVCASR